jgi:hypothetical protein
LRESRVNKQRNLSAEVVKSYASEAVAHKARNPPSGDGWYSLCSEAGVEADFVDSIEGTLLIERN